MEKNAYRFYKPFAQQCNHQRVITYSSGSHQVVIRQSSGSLRKSSGSHHVVVRQFKWSKIISHFNHCDLMQPLKAPSLFSPRLRQVATIRMENDLVSVPSLKLDSLSSQGWHICSVQFKNSKIAATLMHRGKGKGGRASWCL